MSDTRTVVFGDDLSPGADVAWQFINAHRWSGWRLDVVTAEAPAVPGIVLPIDATTPHPWDPPHPRGASADAEFAEVANLTAIGDSRVVLSRASDLLVIGPRGPGLLKALHLGSTAEWLLLHPPAPLLIARHGHRVQRIFVCADGSPHAGRVAEVLARLPWVADTEVTVLVVDDGRVDVAAAAEGVSRRLTPTGAAVEVVVERGPTTATIHATLAVAAPDLVAMGTRGLTGLQRLRLGSTASAIARAAECSVLVACDESETVAGS